MINRQYQKGDSMDDVEIAPLRSLSGSLSSRSTGSSIVRYSSPSDDSDDDSVSKANGHFHLVHQAAGVGIFVLASWHVPRYMTAIESTIMTKLPPFQLLNDGQVLLNQELTHPVVEPSTIPSSLLVFTSVMLPLVLVPLSAWLGSLRQSTSWRLHHVHASLCAFCTAIGFSEGPTQLLKLYIQRPRPNFYALCGFDATTRTCTADLMHQREANFSFPSGHSSLSACACVFMIWYICGMIISTKQKHANKLSEGQKRWACILTSTLLLAWTMFVGATRLHDGWHHHSDVVAGLLLGSLAGTLAYHAWYPPISSSNCGMPYSLMGTAMSDGLKPLKKELLSVHN